MKASTTYRLLADMAEHTGSEDFSTNLMGTFITHLGVDRGLSKEQVLDLVSKFYDAMQPGFKAIAEQAAMLKPEDAGDFNKLAEVAEAGLKALITAKA